MTEHNSAMPFASKPQLVLATIANVPWWPMAMGGSSAEEVEVNEEIEIASRKSNSLRRSGQASK
jgi:hypothetical protein